MYFVYVLKSIVEKKSYVGITDNLKRRLIQHNLGNSFYTRRYKPWKIIYSEKFEDRELAREREKYLKSCAGRKYLKKFVFRD
jgi:putative endonuclease